MPGGEVYRDQKLIVAPFDDDAIQHYSARIMFMSAMAIGPLGLIEGDPLIARAETKLLKRADKLVVLADASKFDAARQPRRLPAFAHPYADHRFRARRPRRSPCSRDAGVADDRRRAGLRNRRRPHERPPTRRPLLEVRNLEKTFPGVRALSGVSFDVRPGEAHALLGENGAGKSTLIKIVSGVYQPDAGEILIDGRAMRFATPEDAKRAGVATIYQELLLFPELTVAENIFLGHAPRAGGGRIDWRAMRAKAEALLASLEIDDLAADQIVGALSVGHRQRVEILRALSHDARILIMDEPTAALTESDVTRLFDIVRRLKARGVGIVYISHRLDELFEIADRVTVLRDGAYVGAREMADTNAAELVQMMVGRRIENLFPKTAGPDRRAGA